MITALWLLLAAAAIGCVQHGIHLTSYWLMKTRILNRQRWDLNICCGHTDGGGVNADIVQHSDVPNYVQIESPHSLPFADGEFGTALCSHTAEHVDDPEALDRELRRVAREVHYVVPPLWDLSAMLNVFEHRWIYLTFKKEHTSLPRRVRLPFARRIQRRLGQRIHA